MQTANAIKSLHILGNSLGMKMLGILSENRKEVLYAEIASMGLDIVTVGFHEKDTDEVLEFKVKSVNLKYIFVDKDGFSKILRLKKAKLIEELEYIICFDNIDDTEKKIAFESNLKLFFFRDFKQIESKPITKTVNPKNTCLLAFTSGTTSSPKIVRISHENLMGSFTAMLHNSFKLNSDDVYQSNSSFSILSEKLVIYTATISGASIGISTNYIEDLKIIRPTIIYCLPRLLDYIYNQIIDEISSQSSLSQKLFHKFYSKKLKNLSRSKNNKKSVFDNFVFKSIQEKFGNRLRLVCTGSALANSEPLKFFRTVLGCVIIETYGIKECGEFNLFGGFDANSHLSGPLVSCEVKLLYANDVAIEGFDNVKYGELCIRNNSEPLGYLHNSIINPEG